MVSSLYRIQMNGEFTFPKVTALIPYFSELGIDGIYCSPIFDFYHSGYDIIDPNRLNPVLGSKEDLEAFFQALKKHGMKCVLDIVPNHMTIQGKNLWWLDVLEKGPSSKYAEFFDINWSSELPELKGKVLLPILGKPYGEALNDIQLVDEFTIRAGSYDLPLRAGSVQQVFGKKISSDKALLHQLLELQFYRLAYWMVATQEINYRRFFNINELIALHMEKQSVFEAYHAWVFELIQAGNVHGLRIDHPDGLYDPEQYFDRLREKTDCLVVVEKILDFKEKLPDNWDVNGTVGYEFLNVVSGLFVQKKNERKFTALYDLYSTGKSFKKIRYERRKVYVLSQMSSEINFLGLLLSKIAETVPTYRDFTRADLTRGCLEVIDNFPVYRTYIHPDAPIAKNDRAYVLLAVKEAKKKKSGLAVSIFDYIQGLLLLEIKIPKQAQDIAVNFLLRFQQLTAPVMAKGLEDSTFYLYNRLISLNEVGGNPHYFGHSKEEFHAFNQDQLAHHPLGLLATSTHDTKFSEDARLRIHAITEFPKEWKELVASLVKRNKKHNHIPDANTEYYMYQMLLALWPATPERLWICLTKVLREAGTHTSWLAINQEYEETVKQFLFKALKPSRQFLQFQKKIAECGMWNSLSSLVLKIGSCGIVDLYQGSEVLNFALMDPDNRNSVDFILRQKALKAMDQLKIFVTARGLNFRKAHADLFLKGDYIPLKSPENVIAFMRELNGKKVIVLVQRFFGKKTTISGSIKLPKSFKDTQVQDVFSEQTITLQNNQINLAKAFKKYPFALLENLNPNEALYEP